MESITFMIWMRRPNHKRNRCGGLITWAPRFAAKKWPYSSLLDVAAATGLLKPKMVRIGDGRSHFPTHPTRTPGRLMCRCPQPGYVWNGRRPGTPGPFLAGQGERHCLASGRTANTHMVSGDAFARDRPALQARGLVGSGARERAAGPGGAQLAGNRRRFRR